MLQAQMSRKCFNKNLHDEHVSVVYIACIVSMFTSFNIKKSSINNCFCFFFYFNFREQQGEEQVTSEHWWLWYCDGYIHRNWGRWTSLSIIQNTLHHFYVEQKNDCNKFIVCNYIKQLYFLKCTSRHNQNKIWTEKEGAFT